MAVQLRLGCEVFDFLCWGRGFDALIKLKKNIPTMRGKFIKVISLLINGNLVLIKMELVSFPLFGRTGSKL